MAKGSIFEGPASENQVGSGLSPAGSKITNGEPGYKKRTGGRFPEVTRELNSRFEKPTKS